MMYWYGSGMGAWGYVLMAVSNLLFWGLLIIGLVSLVRYLGPPVRPTPPAGGPHPNKLLAERDTRGDIDEQEHRRQQPDTLRANA